MAVALASNSLGTDAGDAAVSVTKPTGLAAGDILVAFCWRGSDGGAVSSWSTPSGWTSLGSLNQGTNLHLQVFAKIADSADAAASSFSFSPASASGDGSVVALCRVTGSSFSSIADNVRTDIESDASTGGENAVSFAGGVTPVGANALLLFGLGDGTGGDIAYSGYATANNNPASWTELYDGFFNTNIGYALAHADYASSGVTGNFNATVSGNGTYLGALVSINESVNVTVSPDPVTATLSVQAPSVSGSANVAPSAVELTIGVPAPAVTTAGSDWTNPDKSATASFSNPDKS